jgi:hypothetical protein
MIFSGDFSYRFMTYEGMYFSFFSSGVLLVGLLFFSFFRNCCKHSFIFLSGKFSTRAAGCIYIHTQIFFQNLLPWPNSWKTLFMHKMKRVMARFERLMSTAAKGVVKNCRDIPGPPSLPVIGNLHLYKFGELSTIKYYNCTCNN